MVLQINDKGSYRDGKMTRNVMLSVYPSGDTVKVCGFGLIREPGVSSWKYFSYPLSALRGLKVDRTDVIWLCLEFLTEGRKETVCLPNLSDVSGVEETLREILPGGESPARTGKDTDPTRTPAYFVTEAIKESIGLFQYPAYALHRDDESAAALYLDSKRQLCYLGADGSLKNEDHRAIEERHIHYYGPAGQVGGDKEAAAKAPVDLSWIAHPEAYFLYWTERGRRAAAGEKLRGVLLHFFDPKEGKCADLLLPEGILGFLRQHFPDKDYERQQAARKAALQAESAAKPEQVSVKQAPPQQSAAPIKEAEEKKEKASQPAAEVRKPASAAAVKPVSGNPSEQAASNSASGNSALDGTGVSPGKQEADGMAKPVYGKPGPAGAGRTDTVSPAASPPSGKSGYTAAPVYEKPSYARAAEAAFGAEEADSSGQAGGFEPVSFDRAAAPEKDSAPVPTAASETLAESGKDVDSGGEKIPADTEKTGGGGEGGCPLAHGLHDPNPGGKLTVSQYWDLAKELKKRWDDGLIDEPEYRRMKRELLNRT